MADADRKGPVDQLLDLVVYAPLGLVMNLDELIPQLVEKGHQQVTMARMFGQFAVQTGGKEARKRLDAVAEQVGGLIGVGPLPDRRSGAAGAEAPPAPVPVPMAEPSVEPAAPARTERPAPPFHPGPAPDPGSLGITDYDALSASQVVPRLAGLGAGELEAVRLYETAHRGRKTILAKIAQLQG